MSHEILTAKRQSEIAKNTQALMLQMPKGISLSRKRGRQTPANTVVVSRPTKWSNSVQANSRVHATRRRISAAIPFLDRLLIGTARPSSNPPKYPAAFRPSTESSDRGRQIHSPLPLSE